MQASNTAVALFIIGSFMPTLAQSQTQALQVVHINTSDTAQYLEWAEESMPIISTHQLSTNGGVCVPSFGAEEEGDLYVYTFSADFESSLANDLNSGVPAREIAKIAPHRTIKSRDLWSTVRRTTNLNIEVGDTYSMLQTVASTSQPDMYLAQIGALEAGMREAGHSDVHFVASQVMTGKFRNSLNVRLIAPTPERLGAAMDTITTATWARKLLSDLSSIRTVGQQMTTNCHRFY
tara:strand:- start:10 stop:714 length:705 start_codon:yes stop_codon:yes gene_type:complete